MYYQAIAPVSCANVSVGFDLLGLALKRLDGEIFGDKVIAYKANGTPSFTILGKYGFLFKDKDTSSNIVCKAYSLYKDYAKTNKNVDIEPLSFILHKNLPICSGLGSSASSAVAAICAINAACGNLLDKNECLKLMGILEGGVSGSIHYDNVAPSYLGGLQLVLAHESCLSKRLPFFKDIYILSCYPGTKVATAKAREILPQAYYRKTTIEASKNLATFVASLYDNDEKLAFEFMKDVIAEPYRKELIEDFDKVKNYLDNNGALASGISGSGPSIFAFFNSLDKANLCKEYLERNFIQNEMGFAHVCALDEEGVKVEVLDEII